MVEENNRYNVQDYWDERYEDEEEFEWFKSYQDVKHLLTPHLQESDNILILGCGNSPFSYNMYQDGYKRVTNVDYSQTCIQAMTKKYRNCSEMSWIVMDIHSLTFPNSEFDVVIEKGTIDALLVDEKDQWHLSETGYHRMDRIFFQVSRMLKSSGKFISITFAQPHFRKRLYCRSIYNWRVDTFTLGTSTGCLEYFLYVMMKGEELSDWDKKLEIETLRIKSEWNKPIEKVATCVESDNDEDFLYRLSV